MAGEEVVEDEEVADAPGDEHHSFASRGAHVCERGRVERRAVAVEGVEPETFLAGRWPEGAVVLQSAGE